MKTHTLAAYTPPGPNPPYFNSSCRNGVVVLTIRNAEGVHASLSMQLSEWCKMVDDSRAKAREAGTDL